MARHNANPESQAAVTAAQNQFHDESHSYVASSPHLRHAQIRNVVIRDLTALVQASLASVGQCRVLEIGAGHGTFTQTLLDAGATVTVTEASQPSAEKLRKRYCDDSRVSVLYDSTGVDSLALPAHFELAVCVSVLHHIPDYLKFAKEITDKLAVGGSFYSVQDPCWYERMPTATHRLNMAAYFAWRIAQGDYRRGALTRLRRLRRTYNDSPSDLVEYHVVRKGVDEEAIQDLLRQRFSSVRFFSYWSTQSAILQKVGSKTSMKTSFGISATRKHC